MCPTAMVALAAAAVCPSDPRSVAPSSLFLSPWARPRRPGALWRPLTVPPPFAARVGSSRTREGALWGKPLSRGGRRGRRGGARSLRRWQRLRAAGEEAAVTRIGPHGGQL